MSSKSQQVLFITGASSGIGLATALVAARAGWRTVATVRSIGGQELLATAAEAAGVTAAVQRGVLRGEVRRRGIPAVVATGRTVGRCGGGDRRTGCCHQFLRAERRFGDLAAAGPYRDALQGYLRRVTGAYDGQESAAQKPEEIAEVILATLAMSPMPYRTQTSPAAPQDRRAVARRPGR